MKRSRLSKIKKFAKTHRRRTVFGFFALLLIFFIQIITTLLYLCEINECLYPSEEPNKEQNHENLTSDDAFPYPDFNPRLYESKPKNKEKSSSHKDDTKSDQTKLDVDQRNSNVALMVNKTVPICPEMPPGYL